MLRAVLDANVYEAPPSGQKARRAGSLNDSCALEGRAAFIATGDLELLKLKEYQDIRIVTPREFLDLIGP